MADAEEEHQHTGQQQLLLQQTGSQHPWGTLWQSNRRRCQQKSIADQQKHLGWSAPPHLCSTIPDKPQHLHILQRMCLQQVMQQQRQRRLFLCLTPICTATCSSHAHICSRSLVHAHTNSPRAHSGLLREPSSATPEQLSGRTWRPACNQPQQPHHELLNTILPRTSPGTNCSAC
jgi:hypothetical protein